MHNLTLLILSVKQKPTVNFLEQYVITSECLQRDSLKTGRKVGGEKHEGNEGKRKRRGKKEARSENKAVKIKSKLMR